ncbi:hypothetical protein UY3_16965 [Chelonia mydas]|uniref:DUF7789 domain-containing protein n=1 Tax=Chelonia mydas TaxID=8469 RepID=M7B1K6_CHEMY|nr:hypothetical protein UY3_16965 [Chelonia mydas]
MGALGPSVKENIPASLLLSEEQEPAPLCWQVPQEQPAHNGRPGGKVFCVYYVTRGILQENRQELIVFVLSILLVMFRSIVNFTVVSAQQKPNVLARFILILLVGSFDVICAIILIQSQSMMAFRVGGALESLQSQYFMLNLCFSMLTFDLQAQLCLCAVLLSSLRKITLLHSIILAIGVFWACLKVTVGIIAVSVNLRVTP